MNQKGITSIVTLACILLIVAIAGGAYYLGRQTPPKLQPSPIPSPINKTLNWKTYTNKTLGIEFKYPISVDDSYKGGGEISPFMTVALPIKTEDIADRQIIIFYETGNPSPEKLADTHINQEQNNYTSITKQAVKIDGLSGIKLTYYYKRIDRGAISVFISNSSLMFIMSIGYLPKNKDLTLAFLDQFLTNFKFFKDDQTTNMKTYTDAKYGFSFKYPLDLVIKADDYITSSSISVGNLRLLIMTKDYAKNYVGISRAEYEDALKNAPLNQTYQNSNTKRKFINSDKKIIDGKEFTILKVQAISDVKIPSEAEKYDTEIVGIVEDNLYRFTPPDTDLTNSILTTFMWK